MRPQVGSYRDDRLTVVKTRPPGRKVVEVQKVAGRSRRFIWGRWMLLPVRLRAPTIGFADNCPSQANIGVVSLLNQAADGLAIIVATQPGVPEDEEEKNVRRNSATAGSMERWSRKVESIQRASRPASEAAIHRLLAAQE